MLHVAPPGSMWLHEQLAMWEHDSTPGAFIKIPEQQDEQHQEQLSIQVYGTNALQIAHRSFGLPLQFPMHWFTTHWILFVNFSHSAFPFCFPPQDTSLQNSWLTRDEKLYPLLTKLTTLCSCKNKSVSILHTVDSKNVAPVFFIIRSHSKCVMQKL